MREIPIPDDVVLQMPQPDGVTTKPHSYSYKTFLDEYVWGQPEWRQDDAWLSAQERLMDAFDEALTRKALGERGVVFYASDLDFEKFGPLASLKGKQVAPPFVRGISKMTAPVIRAKYVKSAPDMSRPPDVVVEAPPEPGKTAAA